MSDGLFGFLAGCFLTTLLLFLFVAVPFLTPNREWQGQAIERGYALYCPNTGDFAWKGECKND